jgi:hypothetical protein
MVVKTKTKYSMTCTFMIYQLINGKKFWLKVSFQIYIIKGLIPPPLKGFSMNITSNYIYLYGGNYLNNSQNVLYRFDLKNSEWNSIENPNNDKKSKIQEHQSVVFNSNLYIFCGRYIDESEDKNEIKRDNPKVQVLTDVNDEGANNLLLGYLKKCKDEKLTSDVKFKTFSKISQKFSFSHAHRCIISTRFKHLSLHFDFKNDIDVIDIEELSTENFEILLEFIYSGNFLIKGIDNIMEILNYCEKYDQISFQLLSKICSGKDVYLNITNEIINNIQKDLSILLNNESFSDITLLLKDNSKIFSHKIILSRCPFFYKMLNSGMEETTSKELSLETYETSPMLDILKFLYTDKVNIEMENCIGVLIYSLMLEIKVLIENARDMVSHYFTTENILSIIEIAELYSDSILKRMCLNFIKENYEKLIFNEFKDEKLREEIDFVYKQHLEKLEKQKNKNLKNKK